MINLYKEAGERILMMRTIRGYTRQTLAKYAKISPKFLYDIEKGNKGFSAYVLYNLSRALEVDCEYILTGRPNACPHEQSRKEDEKAAAPHHE